MGIHKPYYRNCRQFLDGSYANSGQSRYILHPLYAKTPGHYVRAFLLIQKDLINLFDYIDTSDTNLKCYSFRTHELLMRACIEVEANCKTILLANGYEKKDKEGKPLKMNMCDYFKLEKTHRLSGYKVKIPHWRGYKSEYKPFENWSANDKKPEWYEAYHETKHNRHDSFEQANLENLIGAICGLLVVLSAQFYTEDFSTGVRGLAVEGYGVNNGLETAIGNYFLIKFPDWPEEERYSFNWNEIKDDDNAFQLYNYNK